MNERQGDKVQAMFNRISPRYDLLNRIISSGRDLAWRKKAVEMLGDLRGGTALDLCCGSGDFLKILLDKYGDAIALAGIDFAARMLDLARVRFEPIKGSRLILSRADAMSLPFVDSVFDAATIGFGIRNVADRPKALREILRVLKPGGRLVMIEPASPPNRLVRRLFLFYFKYVSPLIGGIISGDRPAYRYLHDSFAAFPHPDEFTALMTDVGYVSVRTHPQFWGTAIIYYGEKDR